MTHRIRIRLILRRWYLNRPKPVGFVNDWILIRVSIRKLSSMIFRSVIGMICWNSRMSIWGHVSGRGHVSVRCHVRRFAYMILILNR